MRLLDNAIAVFVAAIVLQTVQSAYPQIKLCVRFSASVPWREWHFRCFLRRTESAEKPLKQR